MELLIAGAAVWGLVAVGLGILLGRSARDADAAELGPVTEPTVGGTEAAVEPGLRAG